MIKKINWGEMPPLTITERYSYLNGDTPIEQYSIAWQCGEHPQKFEASTEWDTIGTFDTLEEAKKSAQTEFEMIIEKCLSKPSCQVKGCNYSDESNITSKIPYTIPSIGDVAIHLCVKHLTEYTNDLVGVPK